MFIRRVNSKKIEKFKFESFEILIMVRCKGRVIALCNIEIVLVFGLILLHKTKIRTPFFSGLRASSRVKIKKKSLSMKNINPNEFQNSF